MSSSGEEPSENVIGTIVRFIPTKKVTKIAKLSLKYSDYVLKNHHFDLSQVCNSFSDKNFDLLMMNQNLDRQSLFKCVVKRGLVEQVKVLLKDEKVDPVISEALYFASSHGHLNVVKELLKDSRVEPDVENDISLSMALEKGHPDVVKELLKDPRVASDGVGYFIVGESIGGNVEHLKILLKYGPNGHRTANPSVEDNEAIRLASEYGHLDMVVELLKDPRVDPGDKNNYAITWAIQNDHIEVARLLLKDSRVDPNAALYPAVSGYHNDLVKEILKNPKVDPSYDDDKALIKASSSGNLEVVKLLLSDDRVNPSAQNNRAILWAIDDKHIEVVELLLKGRILVKKT